MKFRQGSNRDNAGQRFSCETNSDHVYVVQLQSERVVDSCGTLSACLCML